jgi:hypothetical protein
MFSDAPIQILPLASKSRSEDGWVKVVTIVKLTSLPRRCEWLRRAEVKVKVASGSVEHDSEVVEFQTISPEKVAKSLLTDIVCTVKKSHIKLHIHHIECQLRNKTLNIAVNQFFQYLN